MTIISSIAGKALALLGFIAVHLIALLLVLLYVAVASIVAMARWCRSVWRRSGSRARLPEARPAPSPTP